MLKDVKWTEDGTYRPHEENSPAKFFTDGLRNSTQFDLQLGYFNSAAISALSEGFATFISNGGIFRMVINQVVSKRDKDAIIEGEHGDVIDCVNIEDFEELRKTFDAYQEQFFRCLAYLISKRRIQIEIIKPHSKIGIAHTKSGQFRDGEMTIAFTGSANFTVNGLFNNLEEIKIDLSNSLDSMVHKRIENQRIYFESILNHNANGIDYLSPENLETAISKCYANSEISELLNAEEDLKRLKERRLQGTVTIHSKSEDEEPHFPFSHPRDYQLKAFELWKDNKQKGLFAMATGTGKTITALNCLLEIYKRNGYYKAIILVPTVTLVEQWEKECVKFNFKHIIKISSKNKNWKSSLLKLQIAERLNNDPKELNYIIIITYASFVHDNVFEILNGLPRKRVLMIADEAHNMGAPQIRKRLPYVNIIRRIGLSATPERQFDTEGNSIIDDFFNVKNKNYTFEYTMEEAIKNGVLCHYYYFPHLITLTDEELSSYKQLSEKIAKYMNANGTSFKNDPILTGLLLKRKRIIHKAVNKEEAFKKIIEERLKQKGNLKYTLVYVPEGNEAEQETYTFAEQDRIASLDTDHLIDQYTQIIRDTDERTTVREFTSDSKDRDTMLKQFADGELDVLTSMKCLDEGVDVPRSEMAIFCSSTGNPRQFIQRRGRILRTHPDKHMAVIHDLVVAPIINGSKLSINVERNLLRNELKRVQNFALLSDNSSDSFNELDDVIRYYGLSIFDV
ncbi:MAG: DEAD/DEAH box helicase family protein [Prevotella sp.]|jgi:superfamily II DNA or RNA helicase